MSNEWDSWKKHGVTSGTPANILLGAGTIHKGLKFTSGSGGTGGSWNFNESLVCATSGGTKLSIVPEFLDVEVDGALVKTKGLTFKVGETAKIETNLIEITPDVMKELCIAESGTGVSGWDEIVSKAQLVDGESVSDYIEDFAYVGRYTDGTPVIIVFDHALCTSGFEVEGKNKESAVVKATFECYGEISGDLDTLPYHIYTPSST